MNHSQAKTVFPTSNLYLGAWVNVILLLARARIELRTFGISVRYLTRYATASLTNCMAEIGVAHKDLNIK